MIGSFLIRGLVMVLGYAYPAYECYKIVEKNKPDVEQLRFWCQYWILVALLTVCERIGDAFVSWVPMYSEAKLALFIYLWYPKTRGTTYVYNAFFRPYVAKHEPEIDRNLLELKTRAGDMAVLYGQSAFSYARTRTFDVMQYVASQSAPPPRPARPQQQSPRARQPPPATNRRPAAAKPQTEEPPPPTSSASSNHHQGEVEAEVGPSEMPRSSPRTALNAKKVNAQKPSLQRANTSPGATPPETEVMQIEAVPSSSPSPSGNGNTNPHPKETVMEEIMRSTRGRLKKALSAPTR